MLKVKNMQVPRLFFTVTAIVAMWCLKQEIFQLGMAVEGYNFTVCYSSNEKQNVNYFT